MNKNIIYLLVLFMAGSGLAAHADQQHEKDSRSMFGFESSQTTEQQYATAIAKALKSFSPGLKADSIKPIAAPQFYEVTIGTEVIYISEDGRYMLQGDLVDIERRVNLTEIVRGAGRLKLIADLDETTMIVFAPEEVKHTVTVFTDIDCPYCRKLHDEMAAYNKLGISIRYLAYPRAGVGSKAYDKIVAAWCSKDPKAAMTLAKAGKEIKKEIEDCNDPVREHMDLVRVLGVTGTPALIFEDGTLVPGYIPAQRLITMLEEKKQQ
ncbi:Thiol:disulfide interchange protein DsbC [hydrothermal vent metagenome]|uniref:Thiol:disulfide interchange protein DsbC n=1 Tax=hydrothermal vent metagenome TaxID=652676 RepID=A0A3B0Z674_9ZZZZ